MDKFTFIKNLTKDKPHSGKSFYDHLYGTGLLLYKMGEPEYICNAGLYHSVYDTSYYKAELNVTREQIKNLIGEKAENLVYIFCNLENRTETLLNMQDIPKDIHIDLLKLEYVNLIEQNEGNLGAQVQIIQSKLFSFFNNK